MLTGALLLALMLGVSAQADDQSGTVLKIGTPNVIKSASIIGDTNMGVFAHLSNPPLMKMASDGSVVGQTANSSEVSSDGKTWTFHINDNLYWSDGEKLTPEDVKFTFEYLAEKYPPAGWIESTVNKISVDNDAVVFELNKSYSRLNLEFATYCILPEHIWEKIDDPVEHTDEGEIVGFGPFYISKTDLDAGVVYFKKNPYWKGTAPKVDEVEMHMYSNMDVLSLALEKGDVDAYYKYAGTYPYASIQKLEETGKFDFLEKDNIGLIFLAMNLNKEPMSDISFRDAISHAINYEELLKLDALGYGSVPNRGFVPPSMDNFKETAPLEQNIEEAKEILAKAGYNDTNKNGIIEGKDGQEIKLTLLTRTDYQRVSELLKEYLGEIGVDVELKSVDSSTWIKQKDEYDYDLTVTRSTPWGMLMHASWGTGYFDSRRTGEGVLHTVNDTEFQGLCDEILAATSDDQLEEYAFQVQDYYAENLPGIPLYWNKVMTPCSRSYTGWSYDPLYGMFNLETFENVQRTA